MCVQGYKDAKEGRKQMTKCFELQPLDRGPYSDCNCDSYKFCAEV